MAASRYITDPKDLVHAVELDGLTVLFHETSGMTHIVAPPAPEILEALREGPADAATLLARLAARFAFEEKGGAEAVAARLAELELAGLVRRCAPPPPPSGRSMSGPPCPPDMASARGASRTRSSPCRGG